MSIDRHRYIVEQAAQPALSNRITSCDRRAICFTSEAGDSYVGILVQLRIQWFALPT